MAVIHSENKDYELQSLDDVFTQDEIQCVLHRLQIERFTT
jgi:uncharacterized protein YerC